MFLSSFRTLVLAFKRKGGDSENEGDTDDSGFGLVTVDVADSAMKGSEKHLALFEAFFQDYLQHTKGERRASFNLAAGHNRGNAVQTLARGDTELVLDRQEEKDEEWQGFEENLTLWKKIVVREPSCTNLSPFDALLELRRMCSLPSLVEQPRLAAHHQLNQSS